jgi:hypothetical protein
VQQAFEVAADEQACIRLAMELVGHVQEALQCPHANHVLRKCITTMQSSSLQFLIDELVQEGAEAIADAARHRYGCRIIEALLKNCSANQVRELVQYLLAEAAALSVHMYGNFVMQRLLENGTDDQRHHICVVLLVDIIGTGSNFYGAAVLGTAMKHALPEDQRSLARAVVNTNGLFAAILRFRHGRNVKEQLFRALSPSDHQLANEQLEEAPLKVPRNSQLSCEGKPSPCTVPLAPEAPRPNRFRKTVAPVASFKMS